MSSKYKCLLSGNQVIIEYAENIQLAVELSSFEDVDRGLSDKMTERPPTDNHTIHKRHCITNPDAHKLSSLHIEGQLVHNLDTILSTTMN